MKVSSPDLGFLDALAQPAATGPFSSLFRPPPDFFPFLGSQIQVAIEKFEVTCVFFQNHHTRTAKPAIRRRRTITRAAIVPTAREKKTIIPADIKLRLKFLIVVIVGFMNLDLVELTEV